MIWARRMLVVLVLGGTSFSWNRTEADWAPLVQGVFHDFVFAGVFSSAGETSHVSAGRDLPVAPQEGVRYVFHRPRKSKPITLAQLKERIGKAGFQLVEEDSSPVVTTHFGVSTFHYTIKRGQMRATIARVVDRRIYSSPALIAELFPEDYVFVVERQH